MKANSLSSYTLLTFICLTGQVASGSQAPSESVGWGAHARAFTEDWTPRGLGARFAGYHDPSTVHINSDDITIFPYSDGLTVHTGAASTSGRFQMASGSVEATVSACLKAPLRVAIWLQSPNNGVKKGHLDAGREIDIAELYTAPGRLIRVTHAVHAGGYGDAHQHFGSGSVPVSPCQAHVYRANFNSGGYEFFVDGERTWRATSPFRGKDEYLIFSIEDPGFGMRRVLSKPGSLGYATLSHVMVIQDLAKP